MGLLTRNFNEAAEGLAAIEARVHQWFRRDWSQFPFALDHMPQLNLRAWNRDHCDENNCYNFALDIHDNTYRQPGHFFESWHPEVADAIEALHDRYTPSPRLSDYASFIIAMAEADGLLALGRDFESKGNGFPVALFFRQKLMGGEYDNDYHWIALRRYGRDVVWAHKMGEDRAECAGRGGDLTCLFNAALDHGYDRFAGFFEVCTDRLGRNPETFSHPVRRPA